MKDPNHWIATYSYVQSVTAIDQITGKTFIFYFFTLSGKRVHIFTTIVSLGNLQHNSRKQSYFHLVVFEPIIKLYLSLERTYLYFEQPLSRNSW
jgi:hypothetical protein